MRTLFASFLLILLLPLFGHSQPACPTQQEEELARLIMTYRQEKGLPPIPISEKLTRVAQLHARDLDSNFDPANQDGCNMHSWSANGSWTPCCYTRDHKQAECMWNKPREIANFDTDGFEISSYGSAGLTPQQALDLWKTSTGHNAVIVNEGIWKSKSWQSIGIGMGARYIVVWFADKADDTACR
ncbi:MAG: CAP domain-containing protein [Cyclobacteriaceae bacterium]|jgi:hypothetical protein